MPFCTFVTSTWKKDSTVLHLGFDYILVVVGGGGGGGGGGATDVAKTKVAVGSRSVGPLVSTIPPAHRRPAGGRDDIHLQGGRMDGGRTDSSGPAHRTVGEFARTLAVSTKQNKANSNVQYMSRYIHVAATYCF